MKDTLINYILVLILGLVLFLDKNGNDIHGALIEAILR